jgi:hypothetical protein
MSAILEIWNFFEGMRANPHDDEVLEEYKARQRQLVGATLLLMLTCFLVIGATSFFNAADANPSGTLALFSEYRRTVGYAFIAAYAILGTYSLFCAYRIMRLRAQHGAPQ